MVDVTHEVVKGAGVGVGVSVTGQTVVETAIVDVITTVLLAGQCFTVLAQDVVV